MGYVEIFALILLSAFYIIYLTKMLMLKKQNIKGNIMGKGIKAKDSLIIEVVLRIVTFLIVIIQFGSVLWNDYAWGIPAFPIMREAGLILMLLGIIVFTLAVITMRNNWRAGFNQEQDTQLVKNGVYKFSRNPAFVGFDLLYIGCALSFPNIINIVFSFLTVVLFHFQILGEEKFLVNKFGNEYLDYKLKVRRYF